MNKGRTLKVFLVDGAPNGLLTAEIMNWTGHVITGPRSRLPELIQRPEAQRTAVYFLVGPDQGAGIGTQVYIGETDDAARRLAQHNKPEDKGGRDFWERVCVVTSKDANLTKGHIKYLESRLITTAYASGRCELQNSTDPEYAGLPEADRSDMEFFLEQIQTLLPVLGYDFLRPQTKAPATHGVATAMPKATPTLSPTFVLDVKKHNIQATGQEVDGEFLVLKGSTARSEWVGGDTSYSKLFAQLVKQGVLQAMPDGQRRVFASDHAFSAPSAAAAVVCGRNTNGRSAWIISNTGMTYGDWQAELVSQVVTEHAPLPAALSTAAGEA